MLETFTPYVSNIPGTPQEALLASFMEIKLAKVINRDRMYCLSIPFLQGIMPVKQYRRV